MSLLTQGHLLNSLLRNERSDSVPSAIMAIFRFLFLSSVCTFGLVCTEDVQVQERLFLSSLGLSSRPRPSRRGSVPSLLWRIFKKTDQTRAETDPDPCTVPEYGVRGNIVRYVLDQGEFQVLV